MAKGNAQFIKDIIDDSKKSTNTTYSSDKLESLLGSDNADIVYLTAVSATAPSIVNSTDKYYNTSTKLVYEVVSGAWDSGTSPKVNTIYVDKSKDKLYLTKNNELVAVSGSGVDLSLEPNNALENKPDGFYVEDLSEQVKNINIAQKTVNELGFEELLSTPYSFTAPFNNVGGRIKQVVTLDKSIEDYNFIDIYVAADSGTNKRQSQVTRLKVSDIVYNTTTTEKQDMSIFNIQHTLNGTIQSGGDTAMIVKAWFQDATHLYLYTSVNPLNTYWKDYSITHILGIKKEVITIDPVNYINTNQGIEDTPVGEVINVLGNKAPAHYLICDGKEYNLGTYQYLEQHFKELGSVNIFGGDGITTYKVPNVEPEIYTVKSLLPEMTSNTTPTPYVASSDSIHSAPYEPYYAFNSTEGDAYHCWHSLSGNNHWLQIDYGTPVKINGFRLKGRAAYSQWYGQMPTSFKLQGSNDGVIFTDIKLFSGLSWGSNIEAEFPLDDEVEYRYYKLADMNSNSGFICFNKVEFLYNIYKSSYIKYEPTYFIGSINGYEQVDELIDSPIEVNLVGNNAFNNIYQNKTIKDISNYNKLEIITEINTGGPWMYANSKVIDKKDITLNTTNSYNNGTVLLSTNYGSVYAASIAFNFVNNTQIYIIDSLCNTANWTKMRIKAIRGIKNRFDIGNVPSGGDSENLTAADIETAINSSITELNK